MRNLISEVMSFLADNNGNWGKGNIKGTYNIPYNFQWIIKVLVALLMLVVLPFLAVVWLLAKIWLGLKWLAPFILMSLYWVWDKVCDFFFWIWTLLVAFWMWLKGLFKSKEKERNQEDKKSSKWWLWLLLLLLLLLLGFGLFKSCGSSSSEEITTPDVPEVVYYDAFDRVVVARAYLDGVQNEVTHDRVLVGLKYVNGQSLEPLRGSDFGGFAYEQSILQIAEDWEPVVVESLAPDLKFTEQQMVVITLMAMRMGPKGFPRSTFCERVNEGDFVSAIDWFCLQKADGSRREMGEEASLYFYILKMLWCNELSVEELADLPMFSYKNLSVEDTKSPTLTPAARKKLRHGHFRTPREALNLQ